MYFTDEEKEIIKKIALKDRYSLYDFFEDNFENDFKLQNKEKYQFFINKNWPVYVYENDDVFIFKEEQMQKLNIYIRLITIMAEKKLLIKIACGREDTLKNLKKFGQKLENTIKINNELVLIYKKFIEENVLVIQSNLQQFINEDFCINSKIKKYTSFCVKFIE